MRTYRPTEDRADRLPQAMIETTTEFDWEELPVYIKGVIRHAADEFQRWAAQQENPIVGEVVPDAAPALPQADLAPHVRALEAIVAQHCREVLGVHVGYGEEAWCHTCREHWPCAAVKRVLP